MPVVVHDTHTAVTSLGCHITCQPLGIVLMAGEVDTAHLVRSFIIALY